jgi:uncharacterized protein YutE (UPF0331/DUF86 family)
VTRDVALGKLASIERSLNRIRTVTGEKPEAIDDLDIEEIVVLNLQRAIQATIDLAAHLISGRGWGLPDSLKAHFRILDEQRVIDASLSERLQAMIGFRNVAIHDYQKVDRAVLRAILVTRLGDFEAFARAVKAFLAL